MRTFARTLAALTFASSAYAAGSTDPVPRQALPSLIGYTDYPSEALRLEQEGDVVVELIVGPNGRVQHCSVIVSAEAPSLDAASCAIMTDRARFRPAKDKNGKTTTGRYRQRIAWRIARASKITSLDRAFSTWSNCLRAEAARLAKTDLPTAEIQALAIEGCSAPEQNLTKELVKAEGRQPNFPDSVEKLKVDYRDWIDSWVVEIRGR